MTLHCSLQLAIYLAKRRAHMPTEQAAAEAGILIGEARLHDQAEANGEYAHIDTTEIPHLDFKRLTAPADGKAPLRESVNAGRDEDALDSPAKDAAGANPEKDSVMTTHDPAAPLRLYLERIERLKEEIKGLGDDVRDVFAEAKGQGYDVPTMREMLKLRAMDAAKRQEKLALHDTYGTQLGLF